MKLLRILGRHVAGNLVAYLALFMATTGTAYAVGAVGSDDIADDSIRSADLKDGAAVRSEDVVNDSETGGGLTGKDIRENTLVLPEQEVGIFADTQTRARIGHNSRDIPALDGGAGAFAVVDRHVAVDYRCPDYPAENNGALFVTVEGPGDLFIDQGEADPLYYRVGDGRVGVPVPTRAAGELTTIQYDYEKAGAESLQTLLIFSVGRPGLDGVNHGFCHIQAQMFDAVG